MGATVMKAIPGNQGESTDQKPGAVRDLRRTARSRRPLAVGKGGGRTTRNKPQHRGKSLSGPRSHGRALRAQGNGRLRQGGGTRKVP